MVTKIPFDQTMLTCKAERRMDLLRAVQTPRGVLRLVCLHRCLTWWMSFCHSFFMENQYPDEAKREEIANACNSVIQKPGRSFCFLKALQVWTAHEDEN